MAFTTEDCPMVQKGAHLRGATVDDSKSIITCTYTNLTCMYDSEDGRLSGTKMEDKCLVSLQNGSDSGASRSASSTSPLLSSSTTTTRTSSVDQSIIPTTKPKSPMTSVSKHATDTFESSLQSTTESVPSSGTSSTISSSTTSADISSQVTNFNTTQHTISPTFTPAGKLATTHLKPSIVTTIVVTISIFLIVGAAVLFWYKRRHSHSIIRTPQPGAESTLNPRSIFPFALPISNTSDSSHDRLNRGRRPTMTDRLNVNVSRPFAQRVLQNELDVVREKVVELERQEMQTRSRLRLNLTAESAARRLSENAVSTEAEPPDESAMQPQSDGGWGRVGEDADENGPPPQYE